MDKRDFLGRGVCTALDRELVEEEGRSPELHLDAAHRLGQTGSQLVGFAARANDEASNFVGTAASTSLSAIFTGLSTPVTRATSLPSGGANVVTRDSSPPLDRTRRVAVATSVSESTKPNGRRYSTPRPAMTTPS